MLSKTEILQLIADKESDRIERTVSATAIDKYAEAMRVMGYVNRFNRGIETSQQDLIENGNPPATFDFNTWGVFKVIAEELPENLRKTSQKIAEEIKNNSNITLDELSNKLNLSRTAVKKHLSKLKAKGLLERVGAAKGGYWKIKNK